MQVLLFLAICFLFESLPVMADDFPQFKDQRLPSNQTAPATQTAPLTTIEPAAPTAPADPNTSNNQSSLQLQTPQSDQSPNQTTPQQPNQALDQIPAQPSHMLQGGAEQDALMQQAQQAQLQQVQQAAPTYWQPMTPPIYPQMPRMYQQQPQMGQAMYQAPIPLYVQQNSPMFARATLDSRGTPTLPPWKTEPEEIIGKFHVDFFGITIKQLNGPPSNRVFFTKVQKWRGNRHQPCYIWLVKIVDGSGGYFFHCMETPYGPRGWIYPIAKRGPQDKVTPWAIFFDQR